MDNNNKFGVCSTCGCNTAECRCFVCPICGRINDPECVQHETSGYKVVRRVASDPRYPRYYSATVLDSAFRTEYTPHVPARPNEYMREVNAALFVFADLRSAKEFADRMRSNNPDRDYEIWYAVFKPAKIQLTVSCLYTAQYRRFWNNLSSKFDADNPTMWRYDCDCFNTVPGTVFAEQVTIQYKIEETEVDHGY